MVGAQFERHNIKITIQVTGSVNSLYVLKKTD